MVNESSAFTRRDFLHTAVMGAAVLASGPLFQGLAKEESAGVPMPKLYVCGVCGHVEFGSAPATCPVCHAPAEKFSNNDALFSESSAKLKDGGHSHTPVISVKKESRLVPDLPSKEVGVRIGKTMHPMEEAHHIKYIDWYLNDKFVTRFFTPLSLYPAVTIFVKAPGSNVRTVSWCNLHGYWQAESALT